jgi:hypothetical protein
MNSNPNEYTFLDKWIIPAPIEVVFEELLHGEEYPKWWSEAWKRVTQIGDIKTATVGAKSEVIAGGFLPYTITLELEIKRIEKPYLIEVVSRGDLEGTGTWRLYAGKDGTAVTYEWRVRADKPLIRFFSPILKPLFKANHNWVMQHGEKALIRKLTQAYPPALMTRA